MQRSVKIQESIKRGSCPLEIVVVGSIVVDIPMWLTRIPINGETLIASDSGLYPGGKGANQAVQAARLNADVLLVGMIGDDPLGVFMQRALHNELGTIAGVGVSPGVMTSYAVPVIAPQGQYIMHARGANQALTAEQVAQSVPLWGHARMLLVQGEATADGTLLAMDLMQARGGTVMLDPAPADEITPAMLERVSVLTPNQVELEQLLGQPDIPSADLPDAAAELLARLPHLQFLLVTLGPRGALVTSRSERPLHLPAPAVAAVDPTAAGDAFNGAVAWAMVRGYPLREAVELGVRVASLATTRPGAIPSLPRLDELH